MNKKSILYLILAIILLLGTFGIFSKRIDLTQEKRYTLSGSSVKVLKSVKKPLNVEVYLDGDFPARFKQLQSETKFMLEEFRKINPKIDFKFIDPIATKMSQDTLMAMGMQPSQLSEMKDGTVKNVILFPYAALKYEKYGTSIPLIIQQSGIEGSEQLNKSIENLEYNFISNIKNITQDERKNVGIIVNHDEIKQENFFGFLQMALENYNAGPVIPEQGEELSAADIPKLKKMDALVIAKPRKPFSDNEKLILDQYIMNGGKTLWMIDAINAEMDTLVSSKKIVAFPQDLNLTDFFFNYGIRINSGLIKDVKKSALIRIQTGEISGNPQYSSFLWPYFPLGISENQNPITRNINPVKFEFPTALDTLGKTGIKTTVLFESSERTSIKQVPNHVSLGEIIRTDSISVFEKPTTPKIFAVSLQGKFNSAYSERIERQDYPSFKPQSPENKMIVIADGDVGKNQLMKGQPLPLGFDVLTNQQYGNDQFLRNALDYLLDDANLMELRNRNIDARLLDRQRIDQEKSTWQWFNLLLPLAIIGILGGLFFWLRKRKFG